MLLVIVAQLLTQVPVKEGLLSPDEELSDFVPQENRINVVIPTKKTGSPFINTSFLFWLTRVRANEFFDIDSVNTCVNGRKIIPALSKKFVHYFLLRLFSIG